MFRRPARCRIFVLPALTFIAVPGWNACGNDIQGVLPGALDQPQVNAIIRPSALADPYVYGDVFSGKGFNITGFLDTGASGVLLDGDSADALMSMGNTGLPRQAVNGYPVYFEDVGAVGSARFTVSQPFHISIAPYHPNIDDKIVTGQDQYNSNNSFSGVDLSYYNHSISNVRAQISANSDPNDPSALSGVNVLGVPVMKGKVVVMDARPVNTLQLDTMRTYLYAPNTPFNSATHDTDPGIPQTTRTVKLSYGSFDSLTHTGTLDAMGNLVSFTGAQLAANQPTLEHNPFIGPNPLNPVGDTTPPVKIAFGDRTASGSFLLDTGAAASMISTNLASQLDVRYRPGTQGTDNPQLETYDPARPTNAGTLIGEQFQLAIGGVGGTTTLSGFYLKSMLVRTTQGNAANENDPKHLRFLAAPVLVNDIKVSATLTLDGIFGMNNLFGSVLTENSDLGGGIVVPFPVGLAPGAFDWVVFDEPSGLLKLRPRIPGDANHDGKVDFADLVAVAQHYGGAPGTADYFAGGDFNGDNIVDFQDLVTIAQHYGVTDLLNSDTIDLPFTLFNLGMGPNGAQVPEPASAALVAAAMLPLLGRRIRRHRRA